MKLKNKTLREECVCFFPGVYQGGYSSLTQEHPEIF